LAPLSTAPALHTLTLSMPETVLDSPGNVAALRHMPHLRSLDFQPSLAFLTQLLQPPHSLHIDTLRLDARQTAECGALLVHLPSLTYLAIQLHGPHTDFLRQLPHLSGLELSTELRTVYVEDVDRVMNSLHSLTKLTDLALYAGGQFPLRFTADHLTVCFAHMPLLTSLHLWNASALESLRFLSSSSITCSLKELALLFFEPRLPSSELAHIHALSALTELTLHEVFDPPLDEPTLQLHTPPSRLLPALQRFQYE
jgi:hypothetical protein